MRAIRRMLGLAAGAQPALRLLMVCSGNICRSPTAEGVLRAKLQAAGMAERIAVDSAGTHGFHARQAPDPRAQAHARRRGYDLSQLRARPVGADDFTRFQRILAMDQGHLEWLSGAAPAHSAARIELLMAHGVKYRDRRDVPDPYYGSERDFELVLDLVEDACDGLLPTLQAELTRVDRGGGAAA